MTGRRCHPFDIVVRVLAERLRGREPSDRLRELVCSPEVDWERVIGHASAQFVLPAFAAAVRDLDLAASLEPELALFLEAIHDASVERNRKLGSQLAEVAAALNRIGIEDRLLELGARAGDAVAIGGENAVVFDFAPQIEIGAEILSRRGEDHRFAEQRPAAQRRRELDREYHARKAEEPVAYEFDEDRDV